MQIPPIPKELAHLPLDPRGLPIPFFVPIVDGKAMFDRLDERKQHRCLDEHLCPICGRKLNKDYNYVITGPWGYHNRIVTDPPMHQACAEFSLQACPHLYYQKTRRTVKEHNNPNAMKEKPAEIRLIRIRKHKSIVDQGRRYVRFEPVSYQAFRYQEGVLQEWTLRT